MNDGIWGWNRPFGDSIFVFSRNKINWFLIRWLEIRVLTLFGTWTGICCSNRCCHFGSYTRTFGGTCNGRNCNFSSFNWSLLHPSQLEHESLEFVSFLCLQTWKSSVIQTTTIIQVFPAKRRSNLGTTSRNITSLSFCFRRLFSSNKTLIRDWASTSSESLWGFLNGFNVARTLFSPASGLLLSSISWKESGLKREEDRQETE